MLTGTGTAGAYHAGVLRALAEAGVRIDLVAGHGAGAIGAFFTVRRIEEQVLMQVFGEGEARRRVSGWDPQVRKALELVPRAELLLRDPATFVAERARERRVADSSTPAPPYPR